MLLFVEINPKLKRRYIGKEFLKGKTSYADKITNTAFGSGIAMARVATDINEDASLIMFLGGSNGDQIRDDLMGTKVRVVAEQLRDESQEVLSIEEKYKTSLIYSNEPRITREDLSDFYEQYIKQLEKHDVVCIAPNDRKSSVENMESILTKIAYDEGVPVIVKASTSFKLSEILDCHPYGLVVSVENISKYSNLKLNFTKEVIKASKDIGLEQLPYVLITGTKNGILLYHDGEYYYGEEETDPEYFLNEIRLMAGLAIAIKRKYDCEMSLRLALACGLMENEQTRDFAKIKELMNKIKIKKMGV